MDKSINYPIRQESTRRPKRGHQILLRYSIILHFHPRISRLFCPRYTARLLSVSNTLHEAEFGEVTKRSIGLE
jgi:hypothetical protein